MPIRHHLGDFGPYPDEHTRDTLDDAAETLGILRGLHNLPPPPDHHADNLNPWRALRDDPVVRLHLLASLQQQLHADLLTAALTAHDHGYSPSHIALLLNYDL